MPHHFVRQQQVMCPHTGSIPHNGYRHHCTLIIISGRETLQRLFTMLIILNLLALSQTPFYVTVKIDLFVCLEHMIPVYNHLVRKPVLSMTTSYAFHVVNFIVLTVHQLLSTAIIRFLFVSTSALK